LPALRPLRFEPLAKIAQLADEWKQPFQKDYTERTVNETFDKLLNLRADVEKALEQLAKSVPGCEGPAANPPRPPPPRKRLQRPPSRRKTREPETDPGADFENCLEQIWEQLSPPPTRGRSMTTVKIGRARILMSSWESPLS